MTAANGATRAGTAAYAARFESHAPGFFRTFGSTGLTVSAIGFGGYRVAVGVAEHAAALRAALSGGCNLIDTSTNYGDGRSEQLVGEVLFDVFHGGPGGPLRREQVVVVTKAGYVQGETRRHVEQAAQLGRPYPQVVEYAEDCWHCIHPRFLEDQLTRSLQRLRLETVDLLLLHNPEYFLLDAARRHPGSTAAAWAAVCEAYQRRLVQAFGWLEEEVARGRLAGYGVSSNGFPLGPGEPAYTSVEGLAELRQQGSFPHLVAIQLPLNLVEHQGVSLANQPVGGRSALGAAVEAGLGVLTNRPLNAFHEGALVRLADAPGEDGPAEELAEAAARVSGLARQLLATWEDGAAAFGEPAEAGALGWLPALGENPDQFTSLQAWEEVRDRHVRPGLEADLGRFAEAVSPGPRLRAVMDRLRIEVPALLDAVTARYRRRACERAAALTDALAILEPELALRDTLAQRAVQPLASLPGVGAVLVGMRTPTYVTDMLALARVPLLADASDFFVALAQTDPVGAVLARI